MLNSWRGGGTKSWAANQLRFAVTGNTHAMRFILTPLDANINRRRVRAYNRVLHAVHYGRWGRTPKRRLVIQLWIGIVIIIVIVIVGHNLVISSKTWPVFKTRDDGSTTSLLSSRKKIGRNMVSNNHKKKTIKQTVRF